MAGSSANVNDFLLGRDTGEGHVRKSQPSRPELLAEHAILRLEVLDHLALVLVDPAGQGEKEKLERMRDRKHEGSLSEAWRGLRPVASRRWHLAGSFDAVFRDVGRITGHYARDDLTTKTKFTRGCS
jgi:hypothetical protein